MATTRISSVKATGPDTSSTALVTGLCWIAMFSEGYDMSALGAILPKMLADPGWRLNALGASFLASAALAGMFFGGFGFGSMADRVGRKPTFLVAVALFSAATLCAALAPTPALFAAARFLCGVGVGGIVPICSALTYEFAPKGRANHRYALMYSGYTLGILAASLTAFNLLEACGWRMVLGLGALALVLLPIFAKFLPESVSFLIARGRISEAEAIARKFGLAATDACKAAAVPTGSRSAGIGYLFSAGQRRGTIGFWLATFCAMVVLYGLTTWLPQIMKSAGYELGPAILFLGVYALASSLGGIVLGQIADRIGRKHTIMTAFICGAGAIVAMSHPWPLAVTYCIVAVAGIGTVAGAVMITSYLSAYFPPEVRATAVGACLSFSRFGAICGPLVGGLIVTYHLPLEWNFIAYAGAAMLAGVAILVPMDRGRSGAGA